MSLNERFGALSRSRSADQGPLQPTAIEPPPQARVVVIGLLVAVALGALVHAASGSVPTILFVLGVALGAVLFHSRFGFTSAWRQLVAVRQGRSLRAHMLMLAVACTLFAPIISQQITYQGVKATPSLTPLGWGLFIGAAMFGVGMQIGGSCASGTLFAVGSGQTAIVLTLVGFIVGSVVGAIQLPWWSGLPAHAPVNLAVTFGGYAGAWLVSLAAMGVIVALTFVIGRGRRVPPLDQPPAARGLARAVRGSWPLWVGAIGLAVLNALTLWASGSPWGITFAFALWGSKILHVFGVDVLSWHFWQDPANLAKYHAGVLGEKTSVMDLGIILGALVASAAAGAWVLHRRVPLRLAVGAVLGGMLMGYGARIASGCNIGAYFSGIASFSLSGWLWGVMAILGTFGGLALRPLFGLRNPRPDDSVC